MRIFHICFALLFVSCSMSNYKKSKINGVSFVASSDSIQDKHIKPVLNLNANYIAIMPFGFIKDINHPEVMYNSERQWFGETNEGVRQYIAKLKNRDLKIMLKPQIWIWHGEYTGFIEMNNETDWELLENTYSKFILEFVEIAESTNVEIFCIGTELEKFVEMRPNFWAKLIKDIKKVYSGKLTYAANWDEYKRTPFWNSMDYIGIDSYFPLSDSQTPSVEECKIGWQVHKPNMEKYSDSLNKPVLFTEFGYRSVDYTAKEPWKYDRSLTQVNMKAQTHATTALFETFWAENWFAGGFLWKWHYNYDVVGGIDNTQYTPQNKPVENVFRNYYSE